MTASHDEGGLTTFYVPGATAAWLTNRASVVLGPSAPPGLALTVALGPVVSE